MEGSIWHKEGSQSLHFKNRTCLCDCKEIKYLQQEARQVTITFCGRERESVKATSAMVSFIFQS